MHVIRRESFWGGHSRALLLWHCQKLASMITDTYNGFLHLPMACYGALGFSPYKGILHHFSTPFMNTALQIFTLCLVSAAFLIKTSTCKAYIVDWIDDKSSHHIFCFVSPGGFLNQESPFFQEEFPKLVSGGDEKSQPEKNEEEEKEPQYGPGPSLRPQSKLQTVGCGFSRHSSSWIPLTFALHVPCKFYT